LASSPIRDSQLWLITKKKKEIPCCGIVWTMEKQACLLGLPLWLPELVIHHLFLATPPDTHRHTYINLKMLSELLFYSAPFTLIPKWGHYAFNLSLAGDSCSIPWPSHSSILLLLSPRSFCMQMQFFCCLWYFLLFNFYFLICEIYFWHTILLFRCWSWTKSLLKLFLLHATWQI